MTPIRFQPLSTGKLILIGGAEDRKDDMKVLRRMLDTTTPSVVTVIPTASSYPSDLASDYREAFRRLGFQDINVLDIRERSEADLEEHLNAALKTDLFFFTGGDQKRLVDIIEDTALIGIVRQRFAAGASMAGTSAGSAAAADVMIYDGDGRGLIKGSISASPGFGFISGIATDTHFNARSRLLRLSQHLVSGKTNKGIGLAEDTAAIIHPDMMVDIAWAAAPS